VSYGEKLERGLRDAKTRVAHKNATARDAARRREPGASRHTHGRETPDAVRLPGSPKFGSDGEAQDRERVFASARFGDAVPSRRRRRPPRARRGARV
jgi:hypothetical protein